MITTSTTTFYVKTEKFVKKKQFYPRERKRKNNHTSICVKVFSWITWSTILCLMMAVRSMTFIATLSPVSVFCANFTFANVPSPIVLPTSYFPTFLTTIFSISENKLSIFSPVFLQPISMEAFAIPKSFPKTQKQKQKIVSQAYRIKLSSAALFGKFVDYRIKYSGDWFDWRWGKRNGNS